MKCAAAIMIGAVGLLEAGAVFCAAASAGFDSVGLRSQLHAGRDAHQPGTDGSHGEQAAPAAPVVGAPVDPSRLGMNGSEESEPSLSRLDRRSRPDSPPNARDPAGPSEFSAQSWRTDDGLPSDMVNAILQSRDGYLWVATNAGLARFDGVRFEVFSRAVAPQLANDDCLRVFEARGGSLWIGTVGGGLARLEHGAFQRYGRADGLVFQYPITFLEDHAGRQWFGTDEGLYVWDGRTFARVGSPLQPLFETQAHRILFTTPNGIAVWESTDEEGNSAGSPFDRGRVLARGTEPKILEALGIEVPASLHWPFRVVAGQRGTTWVHETAAHRIWRFRGNKSESFDLPPAWDDERFTPIYESRNGILWIGTLTGGLRFLENGVFHSLTSEDGLPGRTITAITEDREGNIWIGTSAGLARLRRRAFTMAFKSDEERTDERTWTVLEDHTGDIWIGTQSELLRKHGSEWSTYSKWNGRAGTSVTSLLEDRGNRLWIGTTGGLTCRIGERFVDYTDKDGLSDANVRALYEDSHARLWIGTAAGGATIYENGRFRAVRAKDGLGSDWVRFITEDRAGNLWLCTTGGLSRWREGSITTYRRADGLSEDIVLGVHEGDDGTLWVATLGGGLCRLKNGKFRAITSADGLPDNTILRILDGPRGDYWMSTPKGIFRVETKQLDAVADGRSRHVDCVVYGKKDGLTTTDCGGGTQPSGWRDRKGRLWFPTSRGVAMVDPATLVINRVPPPVIVEQVISDGRLVPASAPVTLAAGSKSLEVHYTGLSFTAPERVRFRYRLEGYDVDWIDAGSRRTAYYTSLPPGRYAFHVLAANDDGVWNETGARLDVRMLPFFYQTWWFLIACIAGAILIVWRLYARRLRQIEARFAAVVDERNRIARELHDTIARGFTGVSMQLEAVSARLPDLSPEARESLDRARLLTRSSLADARRSVRALRPQALVRGDLASSLRTSLEEATLGTRVRGEFSIRGTTKSLPDLVEDHLLRVGQEAISNALRHGEPRAVRVELLYHRRRVELRIEDDGRGFQAGGRIDRVDESGAGAKRDDGIGCEDRSPDDGVSGGMGLPGMRERLAQIGGTLEITSAPDRGTRIKAIVPRPGLRFWSQP